MPEETRIQSDGIVLARLAYFREIFTRLKEMKASAEVTVFGNGLVTVVMGATVEQVGTDGVTLRGVVATLVGNQGTRINGTLYAPYMDISRVFLPADVQVARDIKLA